MTHPTPEQLGAFSLGQLEKTQAGAIELHLSDCQACSETLLEVASNDTFLDLLVDSHQEYESGADLAANFSNSDAHPRYEVFELLGQGGMGQVYRAQHRVMDRTVALKVINAKYFRNANAVDRFKREGRAAAKLTHPNIVTAYDADQHNDMHFMAMELVVGTNLHDWVNKHGKMEWQRAVRCIYQVASGLEHAHQQGMVHRDIKPQNLMLTKKLAHAEAEGVLEEESVKILDFGLAFLTNEVRPNADSSDKQTDLTQVGTVMGTPDFIAPEQAENAHDADARSDIYSLGATFFFLLTGRPPFNEGDARARIQKHKETAPVNVRSLEPTVPAGLAEVVGRMLAKKPADRFCSVRELIDALNPFLTAGKDVEESSVATRITGRRTRLRWGASIAACIVALCGGWAYRQSGTLQINAPAGFDGKVEFVLADKGRADLVATRSFVLSAHERRVHRLWAGDYKVRLLADGISPFQLESKRIEVASLEQATLRIVPQKKSDSDGAAFISHRDEDASGDVASDGHEPSPAKSSGVQDLAGSGTQILAGSAQTKAAKQVVQPAMRPVVLPADDEYFYYSCSLRTLIGEAAKEVEIDYRKALRYCFTSSDRWIWTQVSLDQTHSEAYFFPASIQPRLEANYRFACRVKEAKDVSGKLVLPDPQGKSLVTIPFTIPADQFKRGDKAGFLRVAYDHFDFLAARGIPGTAWFRFRAERARRLLEGEKQTPETNSVGRRRSNDAIASTYNMMTGGAAVSENLRLDEAIERGDYHDADIDVTTVKGITVQAFDWESLNEGLELKSDPLAKYIPNDQHVLFFPSFGSLIRSLDHVKTQGLQLLQLMQFQSESRDILERYQFQLGLQLNEMGRLIGPQLVNSIAITGGDPDLETGTDLAFIFETNNALALGQLLEAQISLATGAAIDEAVDTTRGKVNGIDYKQVQSTNRRICSYQATLGNAIVVTNSMAQLAALTATYQQKRDSIVSLPEYKFFRNRYSLQSNSRAGLLFISDLTIRRWCGPQWRVGASRRLIARAAIAEEQARYVSAKIHGNSSTQPDDRYHALAGKISIEAGRAQSSEYGNLAFLTPISEIEIHKITSAEKQAYERWRENYERRWRRSFDPIAVQFEAGPEDWKVDITVLPLVGNTQYAQLRNLTQDVSLNPQALDDHDEELIKLSMAVNSRNWLFGLGRNALAQGVESPIPYDPFAWMGSNLSLFVDADPYWQEKQNDARGLILPDNMPLGLSLEIADKVKVIPFLALLRSYLDSVLPGFEWQSIEKHGEELIKVSRTDFSGVAIYYGIGEKHLVFSFNSELVARALKRGRAKQESEHSDVETEGPNEKGVREMLGRDVVLTLKEGFMPVWQIIFANTFEETIKYDSWKNLPILNEWRRLFPETDPLEVHEYFWRRNLVRHQAESYAWNEEFETLESNVFGRLGEPLDAKFRNVIPFLNIEKADFGLSFEHSGIRAKMKVELND